MSDIPGVSRYCTCRGDDGKLLGKGCPELARNGKHGMWEWKADGARVNGRRKEIHRRGFPTQRKAREARAEFLGRQGLGIKFDDKESTGDFLLSNLAAKRKALKPTSSHMYSEYVNKTLIPAIGSIPLQSLRHEHVQRMVDGLTAAGRGATTVRRIVATLSSALSDAVRERRLTHNVAEHVRLPKVERAEPVVWDAGQAVDFLAAVADDPLAPLFEVLIGTGLRRGECLALRWPFVDISVRTLTVDPRRGTLSDVAGKLVFTAPKTTGSAAGVGLSARVVAALVRQAERQQLDRQQWGTAYEDDQLVFAREDGTPLRPEYVLRRFHELSDSAGLPRVKLHSLRHLAATLMIGSGVPLAVASKVLRHSQVGITADLYGHLTREVSHAAVDGLAAVLDAAAAERLNEQKMTDATTVRPIVALPDLLRR